MMSAESHGFGRRDFLKVLGLSVGVALLEPWTRNEPAVEKELEKLETEDGIFYLIFERHDQKVSYAEVLEREFVSPDLHFVEMTLGSAREFQTETVPSKVLFWNSAAGKNDYGPFLDADSLVFFANNSINVAYEGIGVPDDFEKSPVGAVKSFAQDMSGGLASGIEALSRGESHGFVEEKLWEVQDMISESNSEDILVSLRNVILARKLQTLAKHYKKEFQRKPVISLGAGYMHHKGLVRLLKSGSENTLARLAHFNEGVLWSMVEQNGGVDALCTTMVIPVGEVLLDKKESRDFILDVNLKIYLEKIFKSDILAFDS